MNLFISLYAHTHTYTHNSDIDVIIANGEYFVKIHFDLRLFRYTQPNVYIALYKLINFVFFNVPRSSIKTPATRRRRVNAGQYGILSDLSRVK